MSTSEHPSRRKKSSFFVRIKRFIRRCFRGDSKNSAKPKQDHRSEHSRDNNPTLKLRRLPKVKPLTTDPGMRTELLGPKGIPIGYFNMPKSGCSTIKNIFYFLETGEWLSRPRDIHLVVSRGQALLIHDAFQNQRLRLEPTSPYFVFTFVRHPGRRVYSAFVEKILTRHLYALPGIQRHLIENYDFRSRGVRVSSLKEMPEQEAMELDDLRNNFREFLKFVKKNVGLKTRIPPNAHWTLQSDRLDILRDHEQLDFIGKLENFAQDFEHVLRQVGINRPELARMRLNEGPKPPFRYEEVLDADLKARILDIYGKDFERFGYSKD